jgi:hypothetical protein
MASIYVHLCGRDIDNSLLRAYGIRVKEDNERLAYVVFISSVFKNPI